MAKKLKGVFASQEEIEPVKVSINRENDGDAEFYVYNTNLEEVKAGLETFFGLGNGGGKTRKTKKTDQPEWGEEANKPRLGRPRKQQEPVAA